MFELDLKAAEQKCSTSKDDVILFMVRLDNGRALPVFLVTSECLLSVMENIKEYRVALIEYLYSSGYSYGCLKCVGYAK
jgi:hypothetical protein